MTTPQQKSVDVGVDVTKQLITLASAIIPVAIGLIGLRYPAKTSVIPGNILNGLLVSLILYLLSIFAGLCVYFGVVGELRSKTDFDVMYKDSVRIPAMAQQVVFAFATIALVWSLYTALSA